MPPSPIKMGGDTAVAKAAGRVNAKRILRASAKIKNVAIIPAKKLFTQIIGSDLASASI